MHAAPMASRAKTKKHTSKVTTGMPKQAGIPCAMVLTAYSTLFPAIGLFVTVIGAMRKHRRQLDVSVETSEPRGFVVRIGCTRLLHPGVHRIPHPTSVTIAKRPSQRVRNAQDSAGDLGARSTATD
jgi:hypothetical protein